MRALWMGLSVAALSAWSGAATATVVYTPVAAPLTTPDNPGGGGSDGTGVGFECGLLYRPKPGRHMPPATGIIRVAPCPPAGCNRVICFCFNLSPHPTCPCSNTPPHHA